MLKIFMMKGVNTPLPSNISYFWNIGSLLSVCLVSQILTGLFLSMHFCSDFSLSFNNISHIMRDVNWGWLIRIMHANGASLFFCAIYIHISRGIFYGSFLNMKLWYSGIALLLILMMVAFIGYVLPWGQMSFWGATVITNLLTAIPYFGKTTTIWLWGGFSVDNATLTRFYSLHFLMPFILLALTFLHILILHEKGSNNPMGVNSSMDMIPFQPYFMWKDLYGIMLFFLLFLSLCLSAPYIFMDPDNFMPANPMTTPPHIQPEWYFLFAYAILRSIPNKLGGVIALVSSLLILSALSTMKNKKYLSNTMKPILKMVYFYFIFNFLFLTFLGACPVEAPYTQISMGCSAIYFLFFIFILLL